MIGLSEFTNMLTELRATNGKKEKQEILKKYPENKELLGFVLNPFNKFYVSEKTIVKFTAAAELGDLAKMPGIECTNGLISFLERLCSREISGNEALAWCSDIIYRTPSRDDANTLMAIFDKDLKIGIGAKEVNKVWKKLVPEWPIRKAYQTTKPKEPGLLQKYLDVINEEMEFWGMERKLDGLRLLTAVIDGQAITKSSLGNEFTSLKKIRDGIQDIYENSPELHGKNWMFDGEVCVVDEDGNEHFKQAVSQVKRKSVEMENPKYILFDLITYDEFVNKFAEMKYRERLDRVEKVALNTESKHIDVIDFDQYTPEAFEEMMLLANEEGWEGVMLVKDTPYEGKRFSDVLKVKIFEREEFEVHSININTIDMPDPETKIKRPEETFKSINVVIDGHVTHVGTSWTHEQKRMYYKNPELIIGKTVTIQFQGYSTSDSREDGSRSLRIPSIVKIWENGRDV